MAKEVTPNTTEEDIILMGKILAIGDIQHKYAVRLQTVLSRARNRSTNDTAAFLGISR
jgi:hypothetical protein